MNANELRELGQQIARDIAAGLMQATAAGALQFCREMSDAARAADADNLSVLADRIEQEKQLLAQQIAAAAGLKRLALQQRLSRLETAEQQMCDQVLARTPALPAPSPTDPTDLDTSEVPVRAHVRRKPVCNGSRD